MSDPGLRDFTLLDDGTMDTVIQCPDGRELRYSTDAAADYRDEHGTLDLERFVLDLVWNDWAETADEEN